MGELFVRLTSLARPNVYPRNIFVLLYIFELIHQINSNITHKWNSLQAYAATVLTSDMVNK